MKALVVLSILLLPGFSLTKTVSDFSLPNMENQMQYYTDLKGDRLTIIDFWATWCKPCVHAIPKLNELYKEYDSENVQFIGINVDGPRNLSKVRPFIQALGVEYPVLLDTDQEVMLRLNVSALPTLLIVNNKDEIVYIHEGYQPGDEKLIHEEIEKLLHDNE
jgi:cytochrome c biogenesis protein CcmG, thiol:disulfide interchange protein DsbE